MNKQITILISPTLYDIEEDINNHLKNGWELHGNLFIDKEGYNYVQVLIKSCTD